MHEMKNTLDGINSGLDIVEENISKHEKITNAWSIMHEL